MLEILENIKMYQDEHNYPQVVALASKKKFVIPP